MGAIVSYDFKVLKRVTDSDKKNLYLFRCTYNKFSKF